MDWSITYFLSIKRILIVFAFGLSNLISTGVHADSFKIGFISTGDEEANRVQSLIIEELSPFIEDADEIGFVSFIAEANPQAFQEQINKANSDREVNAIIATGFLGSQFIYNQNAFAKPTFLVWIVDPNLVGGEVKDNTKNLHWLSTRNDVDSTFKSISQVIGEKSVTLILDNEAVNLGTNFFDGLKKNADKYGLDFSVTFLDRSQAVLQQIPPDTALALVPPLGEGATEIIEEIQAGKVPVFTFEGPKAVREGAMMTDVVNANESLIARSIALDVYELFQGERPKVGPKWLDAEHHLTINLISAQRMGVNLPIDVISSASIVGFSNLNIDYIDVVTLDDVLTWVLEKNPGLIQSRNRIDIADEAIIQARSALSSQLNAELNHTRNSGSGNNVALGNPDQNTQATLNFSRELYSIADRTDYELAKLDKTSELHLDEASQQAALVNALDVYLQVLIAQANLAAQQENVRLARSNLSMADKRVKLGSGTAGDVYNSEASIARANSELLAARIATLEARRSLMDLSSTEFDENAMFKDVDLAHSSVKVSHQIVQPLLETLGGIQRLASWSAKQAVTESPNLLATTVGIESSQLQLDAADKARYTPEVRLEGQAFSFLDSSTGSSGESLDGVDDVSLSVRVTLPIWTSGQLTSGIRQANKQLIDSKLEYRAGKNAIQVDARNAVYSLAQAWQDIKLGKIALESAEKSLEINQQAYASGALTIENLQSTQSTYISALSADKANLYQYVRALANWQLQVAAVSALMDADAYQKWAARLQDQNPIQ